MLKKRITSFIKNEVVLFCVIVLAIITCFFVPIDSEYLNYFDYNTLFCLFCMLAVVAGLKSTDVFDLISRKIIGLFHTRRTVILALVFGTFFFDMIVANDMSLITFLPLTYIVLHTTNNDRYLAFVFIMQTIAANMGGMITPYGNPQNLYLYSYYHIDSLEFFGILLVHTLVAGALLLICCLFVKNDPLTLKDDSAIQLNKNKLVIYVILFVLVIATIFRFVPYLITFAIIMIVMLFLDRKRFREIDYSLILTFFFFFIFSGNMARIPFIHELIFNLVEKNTLVTGIISCQLISNVPTAIFLSKFTLNYADLLVSVNIGSLGILISSLVSLITLKEFLRHQPKKFGEYLILFTSFNCIFLAFQLLVAYFF